MKDMESGSERQKAEMNSIRLYETRKNDSEWFTCHLTVDDTGVIDQKEIENSRKRYVARGIYAGTLLFV